MASLEPALQAFGHRFNAANHEAVLLPRNVPMEREFISMEARMLNASEVAPGEDPTFPEAEGLFPARLSWLRNLHSRSVELRMHYSEQYRKTMLMIKASSVARLCLSSIVTIFLLMSEPFGEWLPFVGILFSVMYIASVCGPYLARWEDLAQKNLRSEKMFGELATDISAYFVSLGKLKPQDDDDEDEAGPLGEAKEDEEAESPVAQASEIMLTTEASQVDAAAGGGDDAQNLPNVPERAADGEEGGEGDDAEEEDADEEEEEEEEAGDGDDMIEKLLMKSTGTKRLPSLSPEDKRRVAMHLMQTTLSEYAPSALEAGEAINSHKHQTIRANTPYEADEQTIAEGFNMQLQEWYTASLEQHFAHSLMSQSYRRLYLILSSAGIFLAGLAQVILVITAASFQARGICAGILFACVTGINAYLGLINVVMLIQQHEYAASKFDLLQNQMEEALLCYTSDTDMAPFSKMIEKYKSVVDSAPSISKSFLERWKSRDPDDEDAPLLNYLINEAAGDDASLRWADEVIETLNGEEAA